MSTDPFIVYEVNLEVEPELTDKFLTWLKLHIVEMLEIPGFLSATLFESADNNFQNQWTVHYHISNEQMLDQYFAKEAPEMRQQAIDLFGEKFKATRRILRAIP